MKVLVTGATGFIGGHLLPRLVADGHEVIAVVRGNQANVADGATVVEADLSRPVGPGALPAADAVIHLAQANVPWPDAARELYAVNTRSTLDLLDDAARKGARVFVHASSGSVYGAGPAARREDDPDRATDFYARTKQHAEQLVQAYSDRFATVVLRLFAPYGPGQSGRLVPALIDRVRNGKPVTLNEGGRPRLTPTYVDDVVDAMIASLGVEGGVVANVAGDETVSIRELAELIGRAVDREPIFEEGDAKVGGDVVGANERMRAVLGLERLVPLEEGLARTVSGP